MIKRQFEGISVQGTFRELRFVFFVLRTCQSKRSRWIKMAFWGYFLKSKSRKKKHGTHLVS